MLTNDLNDIGEYFKDIKDKFSDEWENENRSIENIRKVILKRSNGNTKASAEIQSILKIKEEINEDCN